MPVADGRRTALPIALAADGERLMRICNACRYCEGYCAVFPALERRVGFDAKDLHYLANLCHDCGECLYACQYAPPHEFGVALPSMFAAIRLETYRAYGWPEVLSRAFAHQGRVALLAVVGIPFISLVLFGLFVPRAVLFGAHADANGAFYRIVPHGVMVAVFSLLGLIAAALLLVGPLRFLRDSQLGVRALLAPPVLGRALVEAMTLRYLDGGGEGCAYPAEVPSFARRRFHHLTFYGFALCFAATTVAAVYHNLFGWHAPYPFLSVPVLLGTAGGIGLLVGPVGLLWLKTKRDPAAEDRAQRMLDIGFLAMLWLTSLTGLLLLLLREHWTMGLLLGAHLGVVAGLFLTMPYGKFVHGLYRLCALAQNAAEDRRGS